MYNPYIKSSSKSIIHCFKLNTLAVLDVTKLFLSKLQQRPRSAIINISSGISELSSTESGIYCSTKQFVRVFTETLAVENSGKIDILCVKPLGVLTTMMKFHKGTHILIEKSL